MKKKLPKIDGKKLKDWASWLKEKDCGCCHMKIGDTELHEVDICMGWHRYEEDVDGKCAPVWKIAWKIGWQSFNNYMQTDLDIDFDMPWPCNEYGDVYDTLSEVGEPKTMKDWNRLAAEINRTARDVFKCAVEIDRAKFEAGEPRR